MCILKGKNNNHESQQKSGSPIVTVLKMLWEYAMLALGAAIAAFAIEEFLVPCNILDGGVVGVSIIVNYLSKIRLSLLTLVFNLPFLIVGYKVLGKEFFIKAGYSMVVFSIFLEVFAPLGDITRDSLLAVCFGGIILGIGVGMVI